MYQNWQVVVYTNGEEILDSFILYNRTESQAVKEAQQEITGMNDVDGYTVELAEQQEHET